MTERISTLFDYGDEIVVDGLESPFDPARIKEITMKKIHEENAKPKARVRVRRLSRTLLLAAALSVLFATSALAAGLSIHSRRQAELREELLQGGTVAGYTEFEVPAADGAKGVTLLSALSDGSFEYLWLNLSPVEAEELISPLVGVETENGREYTNIAYRLDGEGEVASTLDLLDMVRFEPEDWIETEHGRTVEPARIEQRYREQFYDPESKTLTVQLHIPMSQLTVDKPTLLELYVKTYGEGYEQSRNSLLGSCELRPVGEEALRFLFPEPWDFENPETGGKGQILGIELVASGVNTYVTHEDMETVYTDEPAHKNVRVAEGQEERWVSWANAEERTVRENMHLNLADGSTAEIAGYLASGGREGTVEKLLSSPRAALWDIHSIVSVTVGDKTWEIPGHN